MAKLPKTLTAFGKDLDTLLEQAGKLSIREYADQAGVSYKYVLQLRTISTRQPGRLYTSLLKPFVQLKVIDLIESHQLSLRHRGKPLSIAECQELFPDAPERDLVESIKQALESKEHQGVEGKMVVTPPVILSPLYRRVFVGREAEVKQLQSTFDNAISGQGSLVMVVGEPGIGKTAFCEQLAAYVTSRGGKTLIGHCYSERSLSLPYLAFVEALGSCARSRDIIELKKELGTGAADIARIIPEVREKLKIEPRPKGDPDEERYRLMHSVVGFLGNIAYVQPLLLVLEDLHNSDKGTLEMLTYVSRNMAGIKLLVVGTYRDVEVDRTHPLSSALAELRRLPSFSRVLLRGLNTSEVNRMLSSITGQEMPWGLAEAIHRQTEGNPLFVQEVVRYLVEEGLINLQGEVKQKPSDIPVEMHIPDGLRDVIGKRLSSLSDQCNKMLAVASVIGREFPLVLLQKVTNLPDEDLFKVLEEAKKTAVVEERTGAGATVSYRFAHAFFRQTLYEEIIAPRRIKLNQQIARAIEELHTGHLEEYAAQLAEHFSHSSNSSDIKKAINYGEMAAKRATDVYAYGEAVRLLEQAIKLQEVLDLEDKAKKCDLLLDLGDALLLSVDTKRILDTVAPEAFSLAEAIGDGSRACEVCVVALNAIITEQALPGYATAQAVEWAERADHYAQPGTKERALADRALGATRITPGSLESGIKLLNQSFELARRLGDPYSLWASGENLLQFQMAPQHAKDSVHLAEEILSSSRIGVRLNTIAGVLMWASHAFLVLGRRKRAEKICEELRVLATRTGQFTIEIQSVAMGAVLSLIDGQLEGVLDMTRRIRSLCEEAGVSGLGTILANMTQMRTRIHLVRDLEALEHVMRDTFGDIKKLDIRTAGWFCLVLANLGRKDEVIKILERFVVNRPNIGTTEDLIFLYLDVLFLESAIIIGHHHVAELLLNHFAGTDVVTSGIFQPTCVPRHMGGAAALLGKYDEARKYYQEAIKVCTDMGFRPELALTRLQLAELLLEHYPQEKKEAVEHLDFAIKEFREMKMQPSLERALRHKEILKG